MQTLDCQYVNKKTSTVIHNNRYGRFFLFFRIKVLQSIVFVSPFSGRSSYPRITVKKNYSVLVIE